MAGSGSDQIRRGAWLRGAGETRFGKLPGEDTMSLMAAAATDALHDASLARAEIDGLLCGYSTTVEPHRNNMLASVFGEYFGLQPTYCHGVTVAGATGAAMVMLAARLVQVGECENVLVVAGENRLTGVSSESTVQTLAGVGHPEFEAPFGPTIPAYYGLVASTYMQEFGIGEDDLACFAVLMRSYAAANPKAQMRDPIDVAAVRESRPVATPLRLLDCCLISDGGCAVVVSRDGGDGAVRIAGAAQGHLFQHVVEAPSLTDFGAGAVLDRALAEAGRSREEVDIAGIYDSFTITLLAFLEDLGFAARGAAAEACRNGEYGPDGRLPVNTHGGLLSFGHSGAAGGLEHVAEVYRQITRAAGDRQAGDRKLGIVHGEGGIMSSQVSLVLEREG